MINYAHSIGGFYSYNLIIGSFDKIQHVLIMNVNLVQCYKIIIHLPPHSLLHSSFLTPNCICQIVLNFYIQKITQVNKRCYVDNRWVRNLYGC